MSDRPNMYDGCTADLKMFLMRPNRANIVPITYGTVHARSATESSNQRVSAGFRGCPFQVAQLHAAGADSAVYPERHGRARANTVQLGAPVFRGFIDRAFRSRICCRDRASRSFNARNTRTDSRLPVDPRSVLDCASSTICGEHAHRTGMRAVVRYLVPA